VLLLTSALIDAPFLRFVPDTTNGLRVPSQIMIDKTVTVMRNKTRESFGRLSAEALLEVERRLAEFLGIAK
jgi:mRNA interferase MazF